MHKVTIYAIVLATLVALALAAPTLDEFSSRADKKAMRNSLVRFGKRAQDVYSRFGEAQGDGTLEDGQLGAFYVMPVARNMLRPRIL